MPPRHANWWLKSPFLEFLLIFEVYISSIATRTCCLPLQLNCGLSFSSHGGPCPPPSEPIQFPIQRTLLKFLQEGVGHYSVFAPRLSVELRHTE